MDNPNSGVGMHVLRSTLEIILLFGFSLLACTAVALRFWGRKIQKQILALDDYLIVPGLVSRPKRESSIQT